MNKRKVRWFPFDRMILGYCLLMFALVVIFGHPISAYIFQLVIYVASAVFTILIVRLTDERTGRLHALLRLLYPLLLLPLFYRATGGTIFLFFDRFFDSRLVAFEASIFGGDPSLYIDSHLLNPLLNELFSLCYFSFYLMLPVFLVWLYVRRDYGIIIRSLAAVCITFFASYLLFSLYPIEGPRWYFAGAYRNAIIGPVFRPMVDLVMANGAVRGGCMPSSHVAVALVILIYSLRVKRSVGWVLVPLNAGLAIGTVWGRFHYVSDVVVGAAIALIAIWIVGRFHDRWLPLTGSRNVGKELVSEHVA